MSGHIHHNYLPGYSPAQLLHDGCPECESRSEGVRAYLPHADASTWQRAWRRAIEYGRNGLPDLSQAEYPVLRELWQLAVAFQSHKPPQALFSFAYDSAGSAHRATDASGAERT